jgi:hypothetical protein
MLRTASDEGAKDAKDPVEKTTNRVAAVVVYFAPVDLRKWELTAARLVQERPGQTLQATAPVHDAYGRLVDVTRLHSSL